MMTESDDDLSFASVDEDAAEDKPSAPIAEIAEEIVATALRDLKMSDVDPKSAESAASSDASQRPEPTALTTDASPAAAAVADQSRATAASSTATEPPMSSETESHKEPSRALDKLVQDDESDKSGGWGWGNLSSWGTSVLNTAATSVTTFTSQVGEGLYQVLETVESGLVEPDLDESIALADKASVEGGATEPVISQEMVRHAEEPGSTETSQSENPEDSQTGEDEAKDGWLSGWGVPNPIGMLTEVVQKTSSVVQQTVHQTTSVSKKVIGGGLDVLETIGRKTYDALAEGDHGLKKTLEKRRDNRPNLSQTLREAKEQAECRDKEEEAFIELSKSNFGAQFDDFQGLVQLEALEGLYSTSEMKVRGFIEMLPKDAADPLKSELVNIKKVFDGIQEDNDDDEDVAEHDFSKLVNDYYGRLNLNASVQKLLTCQAKVRQLLADCEQTVGQTGAVERKSTKELHQLAIQSLAEMTSYAIEHYHRVGQQLLLSNSTASSSFHAIAIELAAVTKILCAELSLQSTAFVGCLTSRGNDDVEGSATEYITSVYLESSNASGYMRNGFHLLLPVIQLAVIKAHPLFKDTTD
jgi:hypothetical protein